MPEQLSLITEPPAEDDAERVQRRAAYRERLRQYLQDPAFRAIEGFPIADDDAILALSDPPTYTACPNPFLPEILEEWQMANDEWRMTNREASSADSPFATRHSYHREPFAADVSEGKNDPLYNAHSYHTKVPHKAIMRYILHYTEPGDVVLDGFCGTGMTGVAAQLCGDRKAVQELGYYVDEEGNIFEASPDPAKIENPESKIGPRRAILVDLSPAATFIAYNYNTPVDAAAFQREATRILKEVEAECGWMYETWHVRPSPLAEAAQGVSPFLPSPSMEAEPAVNPILPSPTRGEGPGVRGIKGRINYTVWSDVFVCSECGHEIIFWEAAVDQETAAVREAFPCPHCNALQSKRTLERAWETVFDTALKQPVRRAKQVPVLINYSVGKKRYEKTPDADDLALIQRIEESEIPYWFPIDRMPPGDESRRNDDIGMIHVHHFYTRRNLWVLAAVWNKIRRVPSAAIQTALCFLWHSLALGYTKLNRYGATHYSQVNRILNGTLYVSSLLSEVSLRYAFEGKIERLTKVFASVNLRTGNFVLSTNSSSQLELLDATIDYVFVDPPFGQNLMYSELNFLWEAWLRVFTNNKPEAVVNRVQRKELPEYQALMEACFREFYRVLKPGRWMTVEFHNSQNAIWNAIREGLERAGFVIADVRTLDKQQSTFKQVTSTGAVKQDLIISAYKPNDNLEERFRQVAGTGQGVWDFIDYHLGRLPLPTLVGGRLEGVAERQNYLLFDRMVAFHVQRGVPIPLNAAEFYAGLRQRYSERDKMYFLPEQAAEYDSRFLEAREVGQLPLIVTDRSSARQWVRLRLEECPRTEGDLQPLFMREAQRAWSKNEEPVELRDILYEDFIQDDQGRWCAPDPHQEQHLAQLRERHLQRVFEGYLKEKGRLRVFRKEALLAGFRQAWREQRYADILAVASRLPPRVLQEDPQLLMYADNARIKAEG